MAVLGDHITRDAFVGVTKTEGREVTCSGLLHDICGQKFVRNCVTQPSLVIRSRHKDFTAKPNKIEIAIENRAAIDPR